MASWVGKLVLRPQFSCRFFCPFFPILSLMNKLKRERKKVFSDIKIQFSEHFTWQFKVQDERERERDEKRRKLTFANLINFFLFHPSTHTTASIHSLATPIGSLASVPIMDGYGRKFTLLLSIAPLIAGWSSIALAESHTMILMGRIICGIAVGLMSAPAQVRFF